MKIKSSKDGIVYSTNPEFNPSDSQNESEPDTLPPNKQDLRITLDKKLKGGKKNTVVYSFIGKISDFEELGKHLKKICGVGGSIKDGEIILQGDCLKKVQDELVKLGYKYKLSGI